MARKPYYGGYFGKIGGVVNPLHPFWWKIGYFEKPESQYSQYLYRVYTAFKDAAKHEYEHGGSDRLQRYKELETVAEYYFERYYRAQ